MSYDIDLVIDTGVEERTVVTVGNYTSNVAGMWKKALGYSLRELDNKKADSCIEDLRKAIANMEDNPKEYKEMNPPNGWGDYEGALNYLRKLLDACVKNPKCKIDIFY